MWELIDEKLGEIEGRQKGDSLSTDMTAMGRVSVLEDVAKVVRGFLYSNNSDFVTGQTIVVDAGIIFTYIKLSCPVITAFNASSVPNPSQLLHAR